MKNPIALARPNIQRLQAYHSARSLVSSANETVEKKAFLDANESAQAPELPPTLQSFFPALNRYPMPQPSGLLQMFARMYSVAPEQILMGRGSDEAIDLLLRTFCEPGKDQILITPPTYGMYKVSADIQNASVCSVPLINKGDTWELDAKNIVECSLQQKVKLIFLCSPNNPTGTAFDPEVIRLICKQTEGTSMVVVDEAYAEFSMVQSLLTALPEFPNLIVLRTLSKAWAMAGLRCGVAVGHPEVIALMQKVRAPYPLPQPVVELVQQILQKSQASCPARVQAMKEQRQQLSQELQKLNCVEYIYPSQGNFILVRFKHAQIMTMMQQKGFVLRDRNSEPGLTNCVRITIGTTAENQSLLQAFKQVDAC